MLKNPFIQSLLPPVETGGTLGQTEIVQNRWLMVRNAKIRKDIAIPENQLSPIESAANQAAKVVQAEAELEQVQPEAAIPASPQLNPDDMLRTIDMIHHEIEMERRAEELK